MYENARNPGDCKYIWLSICRIEEEPQKYMTILKENFRSATNYAVGLCELILQNRFENDKEFRIHKIK